MLLAVMVFSPINVTNTMAKEFRSGPSPQHEPTTGEIEAQNAKKQQAACDTPLLFMGLGVVLDGNGTPLEFGNVVALSISNATGGFDTVAILPIDSFGNYSLGALAFNQYQACEFILLVIPDALSYPNLLPTYLGNVGHWTEADTFFASDFIEPDTIQCIEVNPQSGSGTNSIRGFVISNINGKRAEPIEDEDIILYETPPGLPRAYTQTDQSGYFEFTGLDNGRYELFVDIAGITMDGITNVFNFSGSGDTADVTAEVDSNVITLNTSTGIGQINQITAIQVVPNPTNGQFILSFNATGGEEMIIAINDMSGKKIYQQTYITPTRGLVNVPADISGAPAGVYFIQIKQGSSTLSKKVVLE